MTAAIEVGSLPDNLGELDDVDLAIGLIISLHLDARLLMVLVESLTISE